MPDPDYDNAQWMRQIGAEGGRSSAAKRYDSLDTATRCLIGVRAARARWKKPQWSKAEEEAYLEGWKAGLQHGTGWKQRDRKAKPATKETETVDAALVPVTPIVEAVATSENLGRDDLISALENADEGRYTKFLTALSSPRYQNWNVATIARRFGITANELATIWRNNCLQRSMLTLIEGLPKTAAAVVEDAQSTLVSCPRCQGFKCVQVPADLQEALGEKVITCPSCGGIGTARKAGSNEDRKRMWQAAGLNSKATPQEQATTNQPDYSATCIVEEIENAGIK